MAKVITRPTQTFEGFEDLEASVAPLLKAKVEADAARKAKDRLIRGTASSEQLAEDAARVRRWEAENEYRPVGLVAMFDEQECETCGDCQYFFIGLFTREEHISIPGSRRWEPVTQESLAKPLPKETMRRYKTVGFCGECLERQGFTWLRSYYENEDPNLALAECDKGIAKIAELRKVTDLPGWPGVAMTPWPHAQREEEQDESEVPQPEGD